MKRYPVIISFSLVALLVLAPVVQAAPPSTQFSGTWISQDPLPQLGDGSMVHLVVKGGSSPQINFQDEWGQACWDAGAWDLWFTGTLRGTVVGNTMTGVYRSAKCGHLVLDLKGQTKVWTFDGHGTANLSDDTLWDGVDTWSRV